MELNVLLNSARKMMDKPMFLLSMTTSKKGATIKEKDGPCYPRQLDCIDHAGRGLLHGGRMGTTKKGMQARKNLLKH